MAKSCIAIASPTANTVIGIIASAQGPAKTTAASMAPWSAASNESSRGGRTQLTTNTVTHSPA